VPYDLKQFIDDCRSTLRRDSGPAGREKIRTLLERLLKDKDFIAAQCADHSPKGLYVLHDDAELGFQILAHINEKARASPPHDHGASWAIYGQAISYTDMIEYKRVDEGTDPNTAKLEVTKKYRLDPASSRTAPFTRSTIRTDRDSCASPAPTSTASRARASTSRPAQ
jgi:predicted metal-dependent enzyme (double-stranded beta helix superfamily)